jgi:endonuclease/exonuclease/phosphatase family metal-dependent hydrolase
MKIKFAKVMHELTTAGWSAAALIAGLLCSGSQSPAHAGETPVQVVTFNILAPCWASPSYYPPAAAPYLNRVYRRDRILDFLASQKDADIIALQEVTSAEFEFIKNALGGEFLASNCYHSATYWASWITVDPAWEPNGNALLLKRTRFNEAAFSDLPLSGDGNHAVYAEARDRVTGRHFRIASVHLDSDYTYNRESELQALLERIPPASGFTDIIAGDFNTDVSRAGLQSNLKTAGFQSLLPALGITTTTSPWGTYNKSSTFGAIDHITYRNASPLTGAVIDFGLLKKYPAQKDDTTRIVLNLILSGSDHFPVVGSLLALP